MRSSGFSCGVLSISSVLLLLGAQTANARLFNDPQQITDPDYDFIIVGAGTAGCVVANRLTETSSKVLLIEAGIDQVPGENENIPFDGPKLAPSQGIWDWNYTVVPQTGLNDRTFPYPRGKLLGGTSAINYMIYNRASVEYFDKMANITGDQGWSWNSLVPYMNKAEKLSPPADGHNTTGQFLSSAHGFTGPLLTTLPGYAYDVDELVMNAINEIPGYPYNEDMNQGYQLGIGWSFSTIGGDIPIRMSSAAAYLPAAANRSNLDILIQSQALKLVNTETNGTQPVFKGVQVSTGADAPIITFNASKEIILSAGSVGTPHLLLLSGIGDASELTQLGIDSIVDLPDVGKNLQDHPLLPNQFYVNSTDTWETAARNDTLTAEYLAEYHASGKGPMVDTVCNQIGWLRIPDNSSIWENATDPAAGPETSHYELVFVPGFIGPVQPTPDEGNFLTVITNIASPASRGSIKLSSSDPWTYPLIDPGFMSDHIDLLMMREAYKSARTFLQAPAFANFVVGPYGTAGASSDDDIDAYIRNFTTTVWHPTSSAAMGNGTSGVVSSDLLVNGVGGLRVVDASVMPSVPPAHPEAPIYIIAERASDIIKETWGL